MKNTIKKKLKNSNVLVTGGAGFIGSHLVKKLLYLGANVTVLDNFITGKRGNLNFDLGTKNLKIVKGSVLNYNLLKKLTRNKKFISHQAALISVPESIQNPLTYHQINVSGTLNLLYAASQNNVKRVVFASSSSVYGKSNEFPQKESSETASISPYAENKLMSEKYCTLFNRCYNLETITLRYFNVFGPRQSFKDEYAIVIPKFINCLLNKKPTPIFGNGKQSRDFIYIDNVIKANLLALVTKKGEGETYNIGSGKDISIIELSNTLQKMLNINIPPKFLPPRKGDMRRTLADISKAKDTLKYFPEVPFEEGLNKTVNWFKHNNLNFSNKNLQ